MKQNVFIYGLFRDQANPILGQFESLGNDSVKGKIFRVDEFYPGFVPGDGRVWGEVVSVYEYVIPLLDEYEGHEYDRVKVITDRGFDCWVYQYKFSVDKFKEIMKGDWMLR